METLASPIQESTPPRTSPILRRIAAFLAAALVALIAIVPVEAAIVTASITNNAITFSASGLGPNKSYTVVVKDLKNSNATQLTVTSTAAGNISPSSGSTGAPIAPGTTIQVSIIDPESGATVGSTTVTKPKETNKIIDAIKKIIKILL